MSEVGSCFGKYDIADNAMLVCLQHGDDVIVFDPANVVKVPPFSLENARMAVIPQLFSNKTTRGGRTCLPGRQGFIS